MNVRSEDKHHTVNVGVYFLRGVFSMFSVDYFSVSSLCSCASASCMYGLCFRVAL